MEKNKTIKQFKVDSSWDNREKVKVMVFSYSEASRKKLTDIAYQRFTLQVYSLQNLDSFLTELYFSKYQVIYLDIDLIFNKLNEILKKIRGENSKNKRAKIYLVTSTIENSYTLEKLDLPKNIFIKTF